MGTNRINEDIHERFLKSIDWNDYRIMSPQFLARNADEDAVNKCRVSLYGQQSRGIRKVIERTDDYYDMEKARDTANAGTVDARTIGLDEDIALMYFHFYGHNFEGGPIVDNALDGWTCPYCHLKYKMDLKTLPLECKRCGALTPLGELKRDGAFRRRTWIIRARRPYRRAGGSVTPRSSSSSSSTRR